MLNNNSSSGNFATNYRSTMVLPSSEPNTLIVPKSAIKFKQPN